MSVFEPHDAANGGAQPLVATAVKAANYSAAAFDYVPVDASAGSVSVTLPSAPADQTRVAVKLVKTASAYAATVKTGGSDVFNIAAGVTSLTLQQANQAVLLQYVAATGIWYTLDAPAAAQTAAVHNGLAPQSPVGQGASGRTYCGAHTDGKNWSFNSTAFYQVDTFTGTGWQAKTLPTNVTQVNGIKVVIFNGLMYIFANNTVANKFEIYSAPLVTGSTQPTWTGPLWQSATNTTFMMHNFRATSVGIFVGEYTTGASEIAGGPSVYRSTNGTSFSNVLQLSAAFTRHIHGIYEDPYNLGTIYVTVGDTGYSGGSPPHFVYKSTDSGATFSPVTTLDNGAWQTVAMGFDPSYVWFASDQLLGGGPYVMDRVVQAPKWATVHHHSTIAVPGGAGRSVVDLVTANASTTVTSATAAFTAADVGRQVSGPNTIPDQTFIASVTNATTAVLTKAATGVVTAPATIRDTFYMSAYTGATDPVSGWFLYVANDASATQGNIAGIFLLTQAGSVPILLQPIFHATLVNYELLIQGGYAWVGRYGPIVLPVKTTV